MNVLWHDQWNQKLSKKIIQLFGEDWFSQKNVLEVGCGHGLTGIELLKLGSNVVFSDIRKEFLLELAQYLHSVNLPVNCAEIDHNNDYEFNMQFDLVIHIGLLYHLKNWKKDLENSFKHSNTVILESRVYPFNEIHEELSIGNDFGYSSPHLEEVFLGEKTIENHLEQIGCKFIKFTSSDLNSYGWENDQAIVHHVYDWTYESVKKNLMLSRNQNDIVQFRRLWLVLK